MTQETTAQTNGLTQRISAEIRAELARQQMSQRRLAELIDMDPALVSKRLTGGPARPFTTTEIDRIASALGVPVEQFFLAARAGAA